MLKAIFYFLLFFSLYSTGISQSNGKFELIIDNIIGLEYKLAREYTGGLYKNDLRDDLFLLINIQENRGQKRLEDSLLIKRHESILQESLKPSIILDISKAYSFLYNSKNYSLALKYANEAYIKAKESENEPLIKLSIVCILEIYKAQPILSTESYKPYIDEFKVKRETNNDSISYLYYLNEFLSLSYPTPIDYYEVSDLLYRKANENFSIHYKARYYEAIGVKFRLEGKRSNDVKKLDSSKKYFKALTQLEEKNYLKPYKFHSFLELGHLHALLNDREKAYNYRNKALEHIDKADTLISLFQYYKWDAYYIHKVLKDVDSSFYALDKAFIMSTDLNFFNETKLLAELNVELDTAETEKQLLIEQQKKKQNRNIAIFFGGSLVLGSIIGLLVYQNKQRKQKIILQDKEVKAQKLQSELKEEELKSINAMVEGQEKERLRIANDLHDDLGSLMANIKIHFGTFKNKDSDNLFQRTNDLIDEAYQKIRNIAHAKNSGVLAKQGLYEAIKKQAKSISVSKEITVKVIENGLSERLENSVELAIFRVVQELITNVIKHAQATELDIHLNQHEDTINIMVEDNGVGFDNTKARSKQQGMGLISVERRIEKLGGTVFVESQPQNGTSVIIDVPL